MIDVFGHQYLGQYPSGRNAFVDYVCGDRRLHEGLALSAHPIAPHVALDRVP
jgi:hypothetical protein